MNSPLSGVVWGGKGSSVDSCTCQDFSVAHPPLERISRFFLSQALQRHVPDASLSILQDCVHILNGD